MTREQAKPQISMSLTPIVGVPWVNTLRADGQARKAGVYHARFDTRDNPGADPEFIAGVVNTFRHQPKLIDLRLGGFPLALEGLVYNDLIFTTEHVCKPFVVPASWTRYRVIDPSWRNYACTWFAVSPREQDYVLYRDYVGHGLTVSQNCKAITSLTPRSEVINRTWIDRNYCQKHEEVHGEKIIDLHNKAGVRCFESPAIGIIPGILDTWELLQQTVIVDGAKRPRFRVFETCENFLDERTRYKWPEAREQTETGRRGGDGGIENPIDSYNHVMKCFAYFWAARPVWVPPLPPKAPPGSMAERLQQDRHQSMQPRSPL